MCQYSIAKWLRAKGTITVVRNSIVVRVDIVISTRTNIISITYTVVIVIGIGSCTITIGVQYIIDGTSITIITWSSWIYGTVVVITIQIGTDTIAVGVANIGAGGGRACAVAVSIEGIIDGGGVAIVAGIAGLRGDAGVAVITVYIGADSVAVGIADAGAISWRTSTITVSIVAIVDGGGVAIVAGAAYLGGNVGIVVVTVDIGADAIAVRVPDTGTGSRCPCAVAVGVYYIVDGGVVTIIAGIARLRSDVGVVVVAIHIGTDTVAVRVPDTGTGSRCPCAVAVGVDYIVDGGVVAIVAGIAGLGGDVGVVVVTIHIGAEAIAIGVPDAGAGNRRTGTVAIGVNGIIDGIGVAVVT